MAIIVLNKSFVKEHQRRKKDGSVYTIAAHYNKRVKKNTEHAPAHDHDLSHLSAEEGAQFNQMHAEQHLAKHYDEHALKQQLQDSKGEHDKLVQEADIQEKLGNHKAATKLRNKAIKVNQRMMRFQRQLSKLDETVQGIGQMKDKLVVGSGALTDDAVAHANYVSKLGAKYKGRIIFPKKVAKPKAAFIPTHTLSDGVPAKHVEDNVYIDKDGNEVQDHYAEPVAASKIDAVDKSGAIKVHAGQGETSKEAVPQTSETLSTQPIVADDKTIPQSSENATEKDSPKEGERNAEGLVFRNGRWHREDEDKEGKISKLREKIKEAGGKEQVSKVLLTMARSSEGEITAHGIKSDAIKLVDMLVQSTGLTKEEVLNELGIKSKSARSKTLIVAKELHKDVEKLADEDNPNSPNYRFRDTGYIGGSRKEDAALMIRSAAKGGLLVRSTAIDWEEIEKNPREAHQLITKSNLFGKVDWDSLKSDGMEPSAGFLVDRIYASVAKEPEDNASIRKDYVVGIETLRDRLETCKTPDEVVKVLAEIRGEYEGTMLSATESEEYQKANNEANRLGDILRAAKYEKDVFFQRWYSAQINANKVGYEQEARKRRKWKSSPELDARYAELRAVESQYNKDYMDYLSAHPELKSVPSNKVDGFHMNFDNELEHNLRQARSRANTILNSSKAKNLYENPVTRAWISLGPKFHAVLNYRNYKGSGAFGGHVTSAKTGKINDWSWAESSGATKSPRSTEAQVKFQLKVADSYDRIGGAAISSDSTSSLKAMFNLRDVQSGNWVLKDINSAKFHVQRSAEAFSDLADILGSDKEKVSMNGRLAMAFGARGKGNAGFGGAAAAHYEPVQRIINLTKMGGGGSLAHEWFHAMDNMTSAAVNGVDGSAKDFVTENLDLLPHGELRDAWSNLMQVMNHGDHYATKKITYTDKDYRLAIHNIDRPSPGKLAAMIKDAPDAHKAVRAVESYFGDSTSKRSIKSMNDWIKVAAAYHDKNAAGGSAFVKAGAPMSSFAAEARSLDGGVIGKYWSQSPEIAARAFQAYVEDKLQSMDRKNDYLSAFADNKYYKDPIFGNTYPFPEGEERKAINASFDRLMLAMKKENVLAKSIALFSKPNTIILLNIKRSVLEAA